MSGGVSLFGNEARGTSNFIKTCIVKYQSLLDTYVLYTYA